MMPFSVALSPNGSVGSAGHALPTATRRPLASRTTSSAAWLCGNWERWLAGDFDDAPDNPVVHGAHAAALLALPGDVVARLGELPGSCELDGTLYCHASPPSDMASFLPDEQKADGELLEG